jgi:hypothetical protein
VKQECRKFRGPFLLQGSDTKMGKIFPFSGWRSPQGARNQSVFGYTKGLETNQCSATLNTWSRYLLEKSTLSQQVTKFPRISWKAKFLCHVTYRPPFLRILSQINSLHCLLSYSFNIPCHVIILLPICLPNALFL